MVNHNKSCTVCSESPVIARDMCSRHYRRFMATGSTEDKDQSHVKSKHSPGSVEHFYENTEYAIGPLDTECLIWSKSKTKAGYGMIGTRPKTTYAHRFSYETFVGVIPDGMFVCHKCDTPSCCNPDHLFLGTPADNLDDMFSKGRGRRDHKVSPEDIEYILSDEGRKESIKELAKKFTITDNYVRLLQTGKRVRIDVHTKPTT